MIHDVSWLRDCVSVHEHSSAWDVESFRPRGFLILGHVTPREHDLRQNISEHFGKLKGPVKNKKT